MTIRGIEPTSQKHKHGRNVKGFFKAFSRTFFVEHIEDIVHKSESHSVCRAGVYRHKNTPEAALPRRPSG